MGVSAAAGLVLALAAGVDGPEAREQAYQCLSAAGRVGIENCRRALELGVNRKRAALLLRVLAQKLELAKRWDEVTDTYRRLAALTPEDPDAHARLGAALLHGQNRPEEALAALGAALELKPDAARVHADRGMALNALGRFSESVAAFEEALRLEPAYLELRPTARLVFEASRRGERWP